MNTNNAASTAPKAGPVSAPAPGRDANHGKGGAYRLVDGKRVLTERSEPAQDPQLKQGA
ncbi:hypothetical protein [Variovorax sp. UMC13]|uniref:hypothetical protein n=1 Tax=Variovorax sp. UMC13 TaxID=1862326 RepID=UPI00160396AC|nr:hypothetical protein [Variovorax sp. UMC13]